MKIVIQCCLQKNPDAGTFSTEDGKVVRFVAQSDDCQITDQEYFCKPDDVMPDNNITWRDYLVQYNDEYCSTRVNPCNLSAAIDLYKPKIYKELGNVFGEENVFILSAGWGLINGRFLLPNYDITFSKRAKKYEEQKFRNRRNSENNNSSWKDFNHLSENQILEDEIIYFFGGLDYITQYRKLTSSIPNQKVIFYNSNSFQFNANDSYQYTRYRPLNALKTNWHYQCAKEFTLMPSVQLNFTKAPRPKNSDALARKELVDDTKI